MIGFMSRDARATRQPLAVMTALTVALAGCGGSAKLLHSRSGHAATDASAGVPADSVRVIRGWSDALRDGHVAAAAHYFRIPSVFYSGSGAPLYLRSLRQVETINAALPCGAKLLSARVRGRYVNALFRLTNRRGPGGAAGCGSGTGQTARTNFLIRDGRIVEWLRAPDQPGDNGSPRATPSPRPSPTPPGTTPGGGNPVE